MSKLILYLLSFAFLATCWAKRYEYQNYTDILQKMTDLSGNYTRYCKLHDVKKEYNYLIDTNCGDSKCEHWYLEITDFDSPTEQINTLPQVLYIGGVHGDEVLGPNIIMNLAEHLLQNIDSDPDVQKLVQSRLLILLPLANPSGFYANTKKEIQSAGENIDPMLDFPYNVEDNQCLKTSASRVINYLFKTYLIQAALVFQGDQQVLSYPWGASNHLYDANDADQIQTHNSPDNQAFSDIARIMSIEAGSNPYLFIKQYPTGKIDDKIGPQNGGLADWAYAGSWETPSVLARCDNSSGEVDLPSTETTYDPNSLKTLVYIAQASYQKAPAAAYLGSSEGLDLEQDQYAYGYIPMNIKLGLALADIVEPYVKLKDVIYSAAKNTITVQWQGGGCKSVDDTSLEWTNKVKKKTFTDKFESQQGPGYYENSDFVFEEVINLNKTDFNITLTIRLTCDQDWATQKDPMPVAGPQTHVVQARVNPDYSVAVNGYKITAKNVVEFNVNGITQLYFNHPVNELSLMMELVPCDGTMGSGGVVKGELKQNQDTFDLVFTGQLNVEDAKLQGHLHQYGEISTCEKSAGDLLNVVTLQSDINYNNSLLFGIQSSASDSLQVSNKLEFADKEAISNLIGRSVILQKQDNSGTSYIAQIVPVQPTSCKLGNNLTGCIGVDLEGNEGVCIVKSPLTQAKNHFKLYIQPDAVNSRVKIYGFVPTSVIDLYRNFQELSITAEGATSTFNVNTAKITGYGLIEESTLNLNPNVALGTTLRVYSQVLGDDILIGDCSIVLNNPSFNETSYLIETYPQPQSNNRQILLIAAGCVFAVLAVVVVCLVVKRCRKPKTMHPAEEIGGRKSPPKGHGSAQRENFPGKHFQLYEYSDEEGH